MQLKIKEELQRKEQRRKGNKITINKYRANKIQTEVITSHKKNVEIDWQWQELEEKEDCQELDQVTLITATYEI